MKLSEITKEISILISTQVSLLLDSLGIKIWGNTKFGGLWDLTIKGKWSGPVLWNTVKPAKNKWGSSTTGLEIFSKVHCKVKKIICQVLCTHTHTLKILCSHVGLNNKDCLWKILCCCFPIQFGVIQYRCAHIAFIHWFFSLIYCLHVSQRTIFGNFRYWEDVLDINFPISPANYNQQ